MCDGNLAFHLFVGVRGLIKPLSGPGEVEQPMGFDFLDQMPKGLQVREHQWVKPQAWQGVVDAPELGGVCEIGRPAGPVHLISEVQQVFGEVGPILPGDPKNESARRISHE